MGKTKHGTNSARAKACKKYKDTGRLIINKSEKAKKIASGKKLKSHKTPKTIWMKWNTLIRNTIKTKPYVGDNGVIWGTDRDNFKGKKMSA